MNNNLLSIGVETLVNLPCYVFWKDKQGVYLGYNDFGAINLGYKNGQEIIGKTDFELFPKSIAKIFRGNDDAVCTEEKPVCVPEKGVLKNNYSVVFLSYKMPLYDPNFQLIGIAGVAFIHPACDIQCATKENDDSLASSLSNKERTCLQYLCQGMTLKMIGKKLEISPRTVETYLERF